MNILRVAPQREFHVRDELIWRCVPAFVPVEFTSTRYPSGREVDRVCPLMRGYVFADAGASLELWPVIGATDGVVGAIWVDGRLAALSADEMRAVETLSKPLEREQQPIWARGDLIAIRRGAWAQLSATVDRIEGGRVVAIVTLFGKDSEVRLPMDQIERA